MAQISVEIICLPGSLLRGNLHCGRHNLSWALYFAATRLSLLVAVLAARTHAR